jgi:hypothetical protein
MEGSKADQFAASAEKLEARSKMPFDKDHPSF